MPFQSLHISVSINETAGKVYEFASNPANLPKWASGLGGPIRKAGDDWIAESPMGTIRIKFAGKNKFGVLDHDVTLPSGQKFYNPMRVFPNGDGCEVVFTLYRHPGVTDQALADDAKIVKADMERLKGLMEK